MEEDKQRRIIDISISKKGWVVFMKNYSKREKKYCGWIRLAEFENFQDARKMEKDLRK